MNPDGFFLGAHHPDWLSKTQAPLFVSRRALARVRNLPRAIGSWALDSGGFTELSKFGAWTLSAVDYAREVRRYADEIGGLAWASAQDWMCEPEMLQKTGLTVEEHQRRTIDNYLELIALEPRLPWVPVVQGWAAGDHREHVEQYAAAGVDLRKLPLVGLGSICRRQTTIRASLIASELSRRGIRLHGFGFKTTGLRMCSDELVSSDSMAWSLNARKNAPLSECSHASCSNCLRYALVWRDDVLSKLFLDAWRTT